MMISLLAWTGPQERNTQTKALVYWSHHSCTWMHLSTYIAKCCIAHTRECWNSRPDTIKECCQIQCTLVKAIHTLPQGSRHGTTFWQWLSPKDASNDSIFCSHCWWSGVHFHWPCLLKIIISILPCQQPANINARNREQMPCLAQISRKCHKHKPNVLTWGWQSFVCQDKLKNQKRKHLGMMYLENIHVKKKPCPTESWPSLLPTTCQDFCDRLGIMDQQTCLGRRCQCLKKKNDHTWL
jgi:hypothetical protein